MQELIQQVQAWANERGLNKLEQIRNQFLKVMSEYGETCDAILHREKNGDKDLIDGLGDIIVTIIVICHMKGIEFKASNTDAKFDYQFNPDIYFGNLLYELYSLNKAAFYNQEHPTFMHRCSEVCTELYSYINHFGFTPEQCLAAAYSEIKDRKGVTVNGTFIKDEAQSVATETGVDLSTLRVDDSVEFANGLIRKVTDLGTNKEDEDYPYWIGFKVLKGDDISIHNKPDYAPDGKYWADNRESEFDIVAIHKA